jgi:hypothetical protein
MHFAAQCDFPKAQIQCEFNHFSERGIPEALQFRDVQLTRWKKYTLFQMFPQIFTRNHLM